MILHGLSSRSCWWTVLLACHLLQISLHSFIDPRFLDLQTMHTRSIHLISPIIISPVRHIFALLRQTGLDPTASFFKVLNFFFFQFFFNTINYQYFVMASTANNLSALTLSIFLFWYGQLLIFRASAIQTEIQLYINLSLVVEPILMKLTLLKKASIVAATE